MLDRYPLEQLGVEKRSTAGAVLMVPPLVEIGDVSVVEKEGLLESSLSLFSLENQPQTCGYQISLCVFDHCRQNLEHLQRFESRLLLLQGRLLLPLIHFREGHPGAGQR